MKQGFLILIIIYVSNCCLLSQTKIIDSIITKELLYKYISALANDSMKGRYSGSQTNVDAGNYIRNQYYNIGLKETTDYPNYFDEVIANTQFYGYNVIGALLGKDSIKKNKVIILSAHYDHIGTSESIERLGYKTPVDQIYNGANDNASGTATVLALAEYFKALDSNNYTLLFVAFTGEEEGLVGSNYMANKMYKKDIQQVFNFEMLGRLSTRKLKPFVTAASKKFIASLNTNLLQADSTYGNKFFISDPYSTENLDSRSDNYSFNKKGVNAVTIMLTSPTDRYYHKFDDEIGTLDFVTMQKVVKAIALAITPLLQ